jgi:putative ABC transport system substrate-binding protein
MIGMSRRHFITLLGGAAAWPVAASAQQPGMPVIGFLRSTTAASAAHLVTAFRQGLSETGFVEGQSVAIDYRWADNQNDRLPGLVAEMIRRRVAVIAAGGIAATKAAKAANNTPIVFAVGADPVRIGIVSSLNRPGGNVTGISFISGTDLVAKRLELLHQLVPKAMAIAVLLDATGETQLEDVEAAARAVGRQVVIATVASERDFNAGFGQFVNAGAGALLACVFDRYIFDPASAGVDTRGDNPGFRRPISRNGLVRLGVHDFSTPSLAVLQHHSPIMALCRQALH